ncbi:MAG TPA: ABC transporter permease [Vicinamibacterales bacterium]|nr:ABC transporter permease [Vicinamibacterales bacterium]
MPMFTDFLHDLRYGLRLLTRARGFAFVSIFTLGLGIGAATTVFSVVNGVLFSPLPYPDSDRIVRLFQVDSAGKRNNNVSEPNFEDWKSGTRSFAAMAEMASGQTPVSIGSEAITTVGATVSKEFFDVIGVRPRVGRLFQGDEQRVGGTPAVIVSDRLWRTRLESAPLDSLALRLDSTSYVVVGVMPPGFEYPGGSDLWLARERNPPQTSRTAHNFQVVARVKAGIAVATAHGELSALSRALHARYGDGTWMFDAAAVPLREQLTGSTRPVLLLLFGAAILLLVIACLNVSNLHLARASTRHRELALRLAIGANRGRIVRQLLAEAVVLSAGAVVVGGAIAAAGVRALTTLQPANLPRIAEVGVDLEVLGFAVVVAIATAVLLGLLTALRVSPERLRDSLTDGQRTVSGGRSERVRQILVVAQVALTLVLLVGAGLLARSFVRVLSVDPGYRTDNALILDLIGSYARDPEARARRMQMQHELLASLRALPGVEDAGLISAFPLGAGNFPNGRFLEMTRADEIKSFDDVAKLGDQAKVRAGQAAYRIASDGYFKTMRIPLVRGRLFDESDGPDAPHVAVISESLARTKWPNQDPIGRFVQFGNMDGDLRGFRIVGIVGDVRELSPETLPGPIFYAYYRQRIASRASVVVRAPAPTALTATARQIVARLDPEMPLQVRTVDDAFDRALAGRRFSLLLIGVFSACALVLATLGVYGLMSYLVAQRTREIGIRLALGADARDVLTLVVGRAMLLAAGGIVVGSAAALGLTRLLDGMLFGVTATDPIAFAAVMMLTLAAVLAASYLPARRAVNVAPVVALRAD